MFTDENGRFTIDFVLAGIPYSVSATDTSGLTPETINAIMEASVDDQIQRARLEALANSDQYRDTLLGAFATSVLPEAIAKAEGLDRAVLRDLIPLGSSRIGTETPIALRFRGKGSVTGQVFAADGVTPVPGAAVNLYPDPGTRQQPRGVFADSNGRFAFQGVPLGVFTIDARNSTGLYRIIAGELLENNGTKDFPIVLASATVVYTEVRGRVFEADGVTPHGRGKVYIGNYNGSTFANVAGIATADADGWWSVTNIPSGTYDVVAISFDGNRKGERRDVDALGGGSHFVTLLLQSTASVAGQVQYANGQPAANALVAGGTVLVRTDTNGQFTLTGVPIGPRNFSAGVERNPNAGIYFPRIGSATLNVVPGALNSVVIRLPSAGRIVGHVYDATGTNVVPNVRVVIPGDGGFQWVNADANGLYTFENMGIGGYTLSAPGPGAVSTDTTGLISKIKDGTEQDVIAAVTEAFAIFTGVTDPYLNGSGLTFNPLTWGFTSAQIRFDGETVVADIKFLRQGTISGKVVNDQGVPIGARVRLTGVGPNNAGAPATIIRGERNSDPALGTFEFPLSVFEGAWTLQAASPFYPDVITLSGVSIPPNRLNFTNLVLKFPPVAEVNGRLVGNIFMPDGSPAGDNVAVKISFGNEITTDTSGFYDTRIAIPKGSYSVKATDTSGFTGMAVVQVVPGVTNVCNVRLQGRGALKVTVLFADGTPSTGASFMLEQGNYPFERWSGTTDANGQRTLSNLSEGTFAVCAAKNTGFARIMGRSSITVVRNTTNSVTVVLAPTATIQGRFVLRDGVTGVDAAQVAIGNIGYAITDTNGSFRVEGVPLGTYRLLTQNPVNGVGAKTFVTLSYDGQTNNVTLIEQSRGEIHGYVLNSYTTGYVPGALVTLNVQDELTPPRFVTTGPDGAYSFPSTPAAPLTVSATDPVNHRSGSKSATLAENVASLQVDVQIEPLARLGGTVYLPDGVTPAVNATVTLTGPGILRLSDTDTNGQVAFVDLPLGNYQILARDLRSAQSRSAGQTSVTLDRLGDAPDFSVRLLGVGSVSGTVVLSDGLTPIGGAVVTLVLQTPLFYGIRQTVFTDFTGRYNFENVPNGTYCLLAEFLVLGVNYTSAITNANQADYVNLPLGASGTVKGKLVRADGVTPVGDVDVLLTFRSQSSIAGYALARTSANGAFTLPLIPLGDFSLEVNAPLVNGIAKLKSQVSYNLQTVDLGKVSLDEADPFVVSTFPADGAGNVPLATMPEIIFSEAIDPASLDSLSMYFCSGTGVMIPATPTLVSTNRVRLFRPDGATLLKSQSGYDVVVLNKPYRGGRVPTDLVGRPLAAPYLIHFTTLDGDAPQVVSVFPSNNAVQIDPRAVMRVSFNEPVRISDFGFAFSLTGPGGPVPGTASVGFNGLVVAFAPTTPLSINTRYTIGLSGARDLSGNLMLAPAGASFDTLDTIGPDIATLRIADDRTPVAGGSIPVEALLVTNEPSVTVRFTQDFQPAGLATVSPYRVNVTLPATGTTTIRAYASDRYGNEGPFQKIVITVVSNQPPLVQLARVTPLTGTVGSSNTLVLRVSAADDYTITNLTLVGSGAFGFVTNFTSGATQLVAIAIPPGVVPPAQFQINAQALDGLGVASGVAALNVDLSDGTAPSLTINSPAVSALLNPAVPLTLTVSAADNSTNVLLDVILSGALAATQTTNVVVVTNQPINLSFDFALGAALTNGTSLVATVRARDAAGNSNTVSRVFRLPDREPPRLVSLTPSNGAPRQSLWLDTVRFDFTKAIATNSVSTNLFVFTNSPPTPYTVVTGTAPQIVLLRPTTLPLQPGTSYTNLIRPGVIDLAGNALVDTNGALLPSAGLSFTFTTAGILNVQPTNGAPIVPGQTIAASIVFEPGLGADAFGFAFGTNPSVTVVVSASATNATANLRLPTNAATATLNLAALKTGKSAYAFPPRTFNVRQRSGDDDGDGWLNGFEADRGMNPFVADLDSDDFDHDGLSNGDERTHGTDPGKADTDGDGLSDGAEVALHTDPLNPDTDFDGLPDGVDPSPLHGDSFPDLVMASSVEAIEAVATNISVTATDVDSNVRELQVFAAAGESNRWQILRWRQSTNSVFTINTNAAILIGTLDLKNIQPGTSTVQVVARDVTNKRQTNLLSVVVLSDLDHDGIPDRDDPDIDGDGLSNAQEIALGTDPRNPDTDGDGVPDNADPHPLVAKHRPVAQLLEGRAGLALDGVTGYAQRSSPTLAVNIGTNSFTVSAWVRASNRVDAVTQYIVSRYECGWNNCSSPDGNASAYWAIYLGDNGVPAFGVRGDIDPYPSVSGQQDLRDGNWHHVAGVLDRSTASVKLYVDGQPVGTNSSATLGEVKDAGSPLSVGRVFREGFALPTGYLNGEVSELRVWKTARTPAQIQSDMAGSSIGNEPGLAGYWPLNESFGPTNAIDRTTNGNNLTLGGVAAFQTVLAQTGTADHVFTLAGTDEDNMPLTAVITALPATYGTFYQTPDGILRGAPITSVPAVVSNPNGQVIFAPALGARLNYAFRYKVTDGYVNSSETGVRLDVSPLVNADTDGDGIPDVYEFAYGFNAATNDASGDLDLDGVSNLDEYQMGLAPNDPDTDHDGLTDGAELAVGTNPLVRDSDGDGLPDGQDPQPTQIVAGLSIIAQSDVTMFVGGTINLNVLALSSNAPVVLLDYWPTNPLPTFVSFGGIQFTNTATNGSAFAALTLNPLHDAAGQYVISLRAAAKDGKSGLWNIHVTVLPDPSPGNYVTRWLGPVSGNWNDTTKWSDGVATAKSIAVIDVPGTSAYTVTMNVQPNCRGWVVDSTNANISLPSSLTLNMPTEMRHGKLVLDSGHVLTINQSLYNGGLLRLDSRGANNDSGYAQLNGSGRVENGGVIEVYTGVGGTVKIAQFRVPVNVWAAGRVVVDVGAKLGVYGNGRINNGGVVEVQSGAILEYHDSTRLTVMAGGQMTGTGYERFYDSSQLEMAADGTMGSHLEMYNTAKGTGSGTLTLAGGQTLTGTYECPVAIAPQGWSDIRNAIFTTNMMVLSNAVLNIPGSYSMRLDQVLTNYGTVQMTSRDVNTSITTAAGGCIVNHGLMQVLAQGTGGGAATIYIPLFVTPPGRLLVRTNATFVLGDGGTIAVSGKIEVQSGGLLRVDPASFARDFMLFAGAEILGNGEVRLTGNHRLLVLGDATLSGGLFTMTGATTARGYGRLTVGPNATFSVDHSLTLPGSLTVSGTLRVLGTGTVLTIGGALVLETGGVINNPGTVKAGSFVNVGGTIIGHAPVGNGPLVAPTAVANLVSASQIRISSNITGTAGSVGAGDMSWFALPASACAIETSTDLIHWSDSAATIKESVPGYYQAHIQIPSGGHAFFRVRTQ